MYHGGSRRANLRRREASRETMGARHRIDNSRELRLSFRMQFERHRRTGDEDARRKRAFQVPECLPLFPLPNVVFFPKTSLPLHIFEPRYCEMIANAARHGQCIGMALLKEGWEHGYTGNPPIFPIGCVGRLVSMQQLPDGRSNVLLRGLARYEISEEVPGRSYRQANIVLKPQSRETSLNASLRMELQEVLRNLLQGQEMPALWQGLCSRDDNDELVVNTLSTFLDFTPLEKQFLLEAESLLQQARRLRDLIQFQRHEQNGAKGWG